MVIDKCNKNKSTYYIELIMCLIWFRALCVTSILIITTLQGEYFDYHQPHFTDEETEAQKRLSALPRSPAREQASQGLKAWAAGLPSPYSSSPPSPSPAKRDRLHSGTIWNLLTLLFSPEENCFCFELTLRFRYPQIYYDWQGGNSAKYKMRKSRNGGIMMVN